MLDKFHTGETDLLEKDLKYIIIGTNIEDKITLFDVESTVITLPSETQDNDRQTILFSFF